MFHIWDIALKVDLSVFVVIAQTADTKIFFTLHSPAKKCSSSFGDGAVQYLIGRVGHTYLLQGVQLVGV